MVSLLRTGKSALSCAEPQWHLAGLLTRSSHPSRDQPGKGGPQGTLYSPVPGRAQHPSGKAMQPSAQERQEPPQEGSAAQCPGEMPPRQEGHAAQCLGEPGNPQGRPSNPVPGRAQNPPGKAMQPSAWESAPPGKAMQPSVPESWCPVTGVGKGLRRACLSPLPSTRTQRPSWETPPLQDPGGGVILHR